MITQKYLKECLRYNPATGVFTWKRRPLSHFSKKQGQRVFNSKFALKDTGESTCMNGYRRIRIDDILYRAHRLCWLYVFGNLPEHQIDHVNGVRHDNRIHNLRAVTNRENCLNAALRSDNKSGAHGVDWFKSRGKWRSRIKDNGKEIHLGYFDDISKAIAARKSAEILYGYHKNHGRIRNPA
jgi:hypothetical protein